MIFFVLILVLAIFYKIQICEPKSFNKEYLKRENTLAIKGIFIILVTFGHCSQYIKFSDGVWDEAYLIMYHHLNQMVVSMFLFYSGYGLMESIKKKGFSYIKGIPIKRFLVTLVNFDIAVCLFIILCILTKKPLTFKLIIQSFVAWNSVGNSNWYIFVVLILYILTFVSFYIVSMVRKSNLEKRELICGNILLTVLTIVFVYWLMKMGQDMYFYDTAILLSLGSWYSLFKDEIEKIVMKCELSYVFILTVLMGSYFISYNVRWKYGIEGYTIWAISFTILIVLFTMKIKINNPILIWFGENLFYIYILQRLPMNLLSYLGYNKWEYEFLIISIMITCVLAIIFRKMITRVDDYILSKIRLHLDFE